jgi:hypothetical protein
VEAEDIVNRALVRDPANGFDDAMALADALDVAAGCSQSDVSSNSPGHRAFRLQELAFFAEFGRGQLWKLLSCSDWIECEAGSGVTHPQTDDAGLYVVLEGGVHTVLVDYELGACFNAKAFSGVSQPDREAVASADTTLLRIEPERLTLGELSCRLRLHQALLRSLLSGNAAD